MASEHNPFRRKTTSTSFSSTPQPVSTSAFLESITSGISRDNVPPEVRPAAKAKVVKRVRVLSPPPSSPSSPESVHSREFGRHDDSSDDASDEDDQFSKRFPELPDGLDEAAPLRLANADPKSTSDNPFGKTLQDIEGLTAGKASSGGAGKSLDVNAFKMLLLTGKAGAGSSAQKPQSPAVQTAEAVHSSGSDASCAADPETPRSSSDIADNSITLASPPSKRKPLPPSSRHGRKISIQTPGLRHTSSETASPVSPSDVNKALPPAPSSYGGEGTEDVIAREGAGRVPEQNSTNTGSTPTPALPASGKRPTPAPPPRRGHLRSQSLTASAGGNAPSMTGSEIDTPPRSSLESQRSRSESFRGINAPAPPPPRRPHVPHRQSFGLASPSTISFNAASSDIDNPASWSTPTKISPPPPPPPARNTSTRRPPSIRSMDATSRKTSGGKENAPPPPPPRQRGSSRSSMDGYGGGRRPSIDSTRGFSAIVPEDPGVEDSVQDFVADTGKGADILADLDALQREVDALRAQQGL